MYIIGRLQTVNVYIMYVSIVYWLIFKNRIYILSYDSLYFHILNSVCYCLTVNYGPGEKTMSNYMNIQQVAKCPNVRHIHFSKGETIRVKGWLQYLIIALVIDLKY